MSDHMIGKPYTPTIQSRNADARDINKYNQISTFDTRYYSGADVSIYFENIYFSDVVNIQYQILEQIMPVYGYASYTADRMIRGSRIIQGAFTINFKRGFYLYSLLDNLSKEQNEKNVSINNSDSTLIHIPGDYEGVLTAFTATGRNKVVNSFKEKFWKSLSNNTPEVSVDTNQPLLNSSPQGFDIYIKYGDPNLKINSDTKDKETGYNIRDIGTMEVLKGVQFTGVNKVIDDSGRPILESYNFMCKDIASY